MTKNKAKEVALITCILRQEDVLHGTLIQTFDYLYDTSVALYNKHKHLINNWEQQDGLDYDEFIVKEGTEYLLKNYYEINKNE